MTTEVAHSAEEQPAVPEQKKFATLNVIVEKVTGTVKWFSVRLHYGFIQRDDNKEDVFVHRTAITGTRSRYPSLKNGESVEFSVVETTNGVNAASVTGPNGQFVKGARFFPRRKPMLDGGDNRPKMNGANTQAGGDVEGTRQRGGPRRMRRGRRPYRPSQNGMGDGENGEGGEQQGESQENGVEGSRAPRQRPRRFRGGGGRGGRGHQRSESNRQAVNGGEAGATEEEGGAPVRQGMGPPRRGGRRFRRGGGGNRMRRGGGNGAPPRDDAGHVDAEGEHGEEGVAKQMENMSLEQRNDASSEKPNDTEESGAPAGDALTAEAAGAGSN